MFDSRFSVLESVFDALFQNLGDLCLYISRNVLPDNVATQWERESCDGFPPVPKVEGKFESLIDVRDLPFMNDQPDVRFAELYGLENLVKWYRYGPHFRSEQAESQICTRFQPWDGNRLLTEPSSHSLTVARRLFQRDKHRPVPIAHTCAAGE